MEDHKESTIKKIRRRHPEAMAMYLDSEIAECYQQYCEWFHAAGWVDVDISQFVEWATTSPLEFKNG